MADGHGGPRTPAHPAAVSGPGSLSQRTDGGPTSQPAMVASGGAYGDRADMEAIQAGSPLQGGGGAPAPTPIPLGAPTQNPGEPVTAGAAAGPGIGPAAAGISSDTDATLDQLAPLVKSLSALSNLPSATPQTRAFVRALKVQLAGRG